MFTPPPPLQIFLRYFWMTYKSFHEKNIVGYPTLYIHNQQSILTINLFTSRLTEEAEEGASLIPYSDRDTYLVSPRG